MKILQFRDRVKKPQN